MLEVAVSRAPGKGAVDRQVLLEALREAEENRRAIVDLRFKHFSTFVVLTSFLGLVAFQVDALGKVRWIPATFAAIVTTLFWRLDARTAQLQRALVKKIDRFQELLRVPAGAADEPPTVFGASKVTSMLFGLILAWWLVVLCAVSFWDVGQGPRAGVRVQPSPDSSAGRPAMGGMTGPGSPTNVSRQEPESSAVK